LVYIDDPLWRAFKRYCRRKAITMSRDGVRMLIRETPEFRAIETKALARIPGGNGDGNGNGDNGDLAVAGRTDADKGADI